MDKSKNSQAIYCFIAFQLPGSSGINSNFQKVPNDDFDDDNNCDIVCADKYDFEEDNDNDNEDNDDDDDEGDDDDGDDDIANEYCWRRAACRPTLALTS